MFIPLGDDNSRLTTKPYVVWAIFAVNALVWLLQLLLGEPFSYGYSSIPLEITTGVDLVGAVRIDIGGRSVMLEHQPGPGVIYLTLLTSMFMHGSWMHIIGNMVYLLIFGDQIEDLLGHAKFLVFYLVCGLIAALAQIVVDPDSVVPCLGASGAIAGVLGAYWIRHPFNRVKVIFFHSIHYMPAYLVLGGWIVLQLMSQIGVEAESGVAYMAHIGGFAAGLLLILLLGGRPRDIYRPRRI